MPETQQENTTIKLDWDEYLNIKNLRDSQIEQFRLATEREISLLLSTVNPDSAAEFFAKLFNDQRVQPVNNLEETYYKVGNFASPLATSIVNAKNSAPFKNRQLTIERSQTRNPRSYALLATNGPNGYVNILEDPNIPEQVIEIHEKARIISAEYTDTDIKELIDKLYKAYAGRALDIPEVLLEKANKLLNPTGITICVRNGIAILAKCNTKRFSTLLPGQIETPIIVIANETSAFSLREITSPPPPTPSKSPELAELQEQIQTLQAELANATTLSTAQERQLAELAKQLQEALRQKDFAEALAADYFARLSGNGHKEATPRRKKTPPPETPANQGPTSETTTPPAAPPQPVPKTYTIQNIAFSPIPTRTDADKAIGDIAREVIKDWEEITRDEVAQIVNVLNQIRNQSSPVMKAINDYIETARKRILGNSEIRGPKLQEQRGFIMRTRI